MTRFHGVSWIVPNYMTFSAMCVLQRTYYDRTMLAVVVSTGTLAYVGGGQGSGVSDSRR